MAGGNGGCMPLQRYNSNGSRETSSPKAVQPRGRGKRARHKTHTPSINRSRKSRRNSDYGGKGPLVIVTLSLSLSPFVTKVMRRYPIQRHLPVRLSRNPVGFSPTWMHERASLSKPIRSHAFRPQQDHNRKGINPPPRHACWIPRLTSIP